MTYDYRTLTPDDQALWRALRLEELRNYPEAFLTTAAEQEARSPEEDRAGLAHGTWRGLFHAEDPIGLAAVLPMPRAAARHRIEIGAVYIRAGFRGTGAAQALLEAWEDEAHDYGALQLELDVACNNPRAIRFYERNGYERMGRKPRAMMRDGVGLDDFFYVKFLD